MEENRYDNYLKYIPGVRFWIIITGVFVTFTVVKVASHFVNMVLVAALLTVISMGPLAWLKKKGVNKVLSKLLVISFIILLVLGIELISVCL